VAAGELVVLLGDSGCGKTTTLKMVNRLVEPTAGSVRIDGQDAAGLPAPLESPPGVVAPVKVYLDRVEVDVTRATLAPGYVGFYLVEFIVPDLINSGPAELFLEAGSASSNRVVVFLEQ